jgi:hypothetical protein
VVVPRLILAALLAFGGVVVLSVLASSPIWQGLKRIGWPVLAVAVVYLVLGVGLNQREWQRRVFADSVLSREWLVIALDVTLTAALAWFFASSRRREQMPGLGARLALIDLYSRDDDLPLSEDDMTSINPEILDLPRKLLTFSVTSTSPLAIRLSELYLDVRAVEPLTEITFPYYGEGAPGPEPIFGWVRLEPRVGRYRIDTSVKSYLGSGHDPSDFKIRVFSVAGYRYEIQVGARWRYNMRPGAAHDYVFEGPCYTVLGFPRLEPWQGVVHGARCLRILHYRFYSNLMSELDAELMASSWILIPERELGHHPSDEERVGIVPEGVEEGFVSIVGKIDMWESRPRCFIVVDDDLLILQEDRLDRASVIRDKARVDEVADAYDALATTVFGSSYRAI